MNIVITGCKKEVLAKIKELVKEEEKENEMIEVKKGIRKAFDEQQKAEIMEDLKDTVGQIDNLMGRIYKMRPDWKPKEQKRFDPRTCSDKPFNENCVDSAYNNLRGK